MRVLLTGIQGTYNYGCEAIIRGTAIILRNMIPDVKIDYVSPNRLADDAKRLQGSGVQVIGYDITTKMKFFTNRVLRKLNLPNSVNRFSAFYLKKYDAVLSIGGDIYTIWSNGGYARHLVELGDLCERIHVPYILWGCSVGPFEKNPEIKLVFQKHLKRISLIVAREQVTIDYLKTIGVDKNVIFSFDPAFSVQFPTGKDNEKKMTLGVNLSPLSLKYLNFDESECVKMYADLLCGFIEQFGHKIILLPHVVDCVNSDNDLYYLRKIYKAIPSNIREHVTLVNNDPGFVGIKKYINQCDVVIAARMHCAINAVATGVPAIFLSYSEKSKGMSKLVYGSTDYCIPLSQFNIGNIEELEHLMSNVKLDSNIMDRIKDKENVKIAFEKIIKRTI